MIQPFRLVFLDLLRHVKHVSYYILGHNDRVFTRHLGVSVNIELDTHILQSLLVCSMVKFLSL
jgi:hypothetical protein